MNKLYFFTLLVSLFFSSKNFYAQGLTCQTAVPISDGVHTASTLAGTPSTPGLDGNGNTLKAGWYAYTPTSGGTLVISSCGGGADTRLWVWSGTCNALTAIANNDDFSGCFSTGSAPYASKIEQLEVAAGTTYFFEWDSQWEATGFTWNCQLTPFDINNDLAITYLNNRYTRIPISQANAGIQLGATLKNLSGSVVTDAVLTAEVYEYPNLSTPIASFSSPPVVIQSGHTQNVSAGIWLPNLSTTQEYFIKYTKTQAQIDIQTNNDTSSQVLRIDWNDYARDNGNLQGSYSWSSTNFTWKQGNIFSFKVADQVTGVSYFISSSSTTQVYKILAYSIIGGVVSNNPIYSSADITANGPGWKTHNFSNPLVVGAGNSYLFVVSHSGTSAFNLGTSNSIQTDNKSLVKVGSGGWIPLESYGLDAVFMFRVKTGSAPTNDVAILNHKNPGGSYTSVHTRQALNGNALSFWVSAINQGSAAVQNVSLTASVKDAQNNVLYSATSPSQNLNPGQIDTFTVTGFNIVNLGSYTIEFQINNPSDQVPINNNLTTSFRRTKNELSRTIAYDGSFGINATTIASNILMGNLFTLGSNDALDSVRFELAPGTPTGYNTSVRIYPAILDANGNYTPASQPIAQTNNYTINAAQHLNGATITLAINGGTLNLSAGTYFIGVFQATSAIGNIRLATSTKYYEPNTVYYRYDQSNGGNWQIPTAQNFSFVIQPIFKTCLPFNANVQSTSPNCGQANGSIQLTANGGTGNISYLWSNGMNQSNLSNLAAGIYEVVLTDQNACEQTLQVIIANQSSLNVTGITQHSTCANVPSGQIQLTVNQGQAPYSYTWSNMLQNTPIVNYLEPGIYHCQITDANGCQQFYVDTVEALSALSASVSGNMVLCNASQLGNLEVSAAHGVAPYTYLWSGSNLSSPIHSGLTVGTYTCIVGDNLGCLDTISATVALSTLSASSTLQAPQCPGAYTGSIELIPNGGVPPYQYVWSNCVLNSPILSGLPSGSFACTITDQSGCTTVNVATLIAPDIWQVNANLTPELFGSDGSISLAVSGATPPYSYAWNNNLLDASITQLSSGSYQVLITDSEGCTYTNSYTIESWVGLEENEPLELLLYPNPSNGIFYLDGPTPSKLQIRNLFSVAVPFEVNEIGPMHTEIRINDLPNGTYLLEIQVAEQVYRKFLQLVH